MRRTKTALQGAAGIAQPRASGTPWWAANAVVVVVALIAGLLVVKEPAVHVAAVTFGVVAIWASATFPGVALATTVLLGTSFLGFVRTQDLPWWRVPGIGTLYLQDAVLLGLAVVAVVRLVNRRQMPLFALPVMVLIATTGTAVVVGILTGVGGLSSVVNWGRTVILGYLPYVVLVGFMDGRERVWTAVKVVVGATIVTTLTQSLVFLGVAGIPSTLGVQGLSYATGFIVVGTESVPYVWNGAPAVTLLAMLIGASLAGGQSRYRWAWACVAVLGGAGIVLSLVRQWYVYSLLGLMALVVFLRGRRFRTATVLVALALFLTAALAALGPAVSWSGDGNLLGVVGQRAQTILNPARETNFVVRAASLRVQAASFLESPVVGGAFSRDAVSRVTGDTGAANTLVLSGALGLLGVIFLIAFFFIRGRAAWRASTSGPERALLAGTIAAWVGMCFGYALFADFFTGRGIGVVLCMAIVDRLRDSDDGERDLHWAA